MIYVETGSEDVFFNFGLEYYFASEKELPEPVFLFWRTTPTLMVGKYQNTLEEINRAYAEAHGIAVVRRLSGGGTIYTDRGGWQYTFITRGDAGAIEFHQYLAPVLDALHALGADAVFTGRNDLLVDGKKISGTAQYKLPGVTVHHGSLLFDTDFEQMMAATTVSAEKFSSKSIKSVRERVTNLAEHLPQVTSPEDFKEKMVSAILRGGARYTLTAEDIAAAERIADERFRPWSCRYGADPKCTYSRAARFAGGRVQVQLDLQKGTIRSAQLSGDFFASEKLEALKTALCGCIYEKDAVRAVLSPYENVIYGVTQDELLTLFFPEGE